MEYPEDLGTGRPAQPELSEQFFWLGVALAAQNKTAEVTKAWETAAQGHGPRDNGKPDVFSALACRKLGQDDRAQQILQQAIAAASRPAARPSDLYTAGMAAEFQGDTEHAQQYFRRVLALDPLFWQARVAIAEIDSAGTFRAAL
jgi:tetratricopeptide (TPR) repeat protein